MAKEEKMMEITYTVSNDDGGRPLCDSLAPTHQAGIMVKSLPTLFQAGGLEGRALQKAEAFFTDIVLIWTGFQGF
jgi:hypothetical protein